MANLKLEPQYFQDRGGYKILHLAAIGGYIDILDTVLKDESIEINEKTSNKDSAMHLASLQDNNIVVDLLLKHNERLRKDADKDDKNTSLDLLVEHNEKLKIKDKEIKTELSTMFLDFNGDGMPPMHVAAANGNKSALKIFFEAYYSNQRKSRQAMFNQEKATKEMLGIKDSSGKSILHQGQRFIEITKLILQQGIDVLFETDKRERYL